MAKGTEDETAEGQGCAEPASKGQKLLNETSTTTKATPSFLGIPGELRNEIYRLVLDEGIGPTGHKIDYEVNDYPTQPGILMVNRRIREEAIAVFDENDFIVNINDMKPAPHPNHWCWQRPNMGLYFNPPWNWSSFKLWLKKSHDGEKHPAQVVVERPLSLQNSGVVTVVQAFRIVDIFQDESWEKVEAALEAYRVGVNASQNGEDFFK